MARLLTPRRRAASLQAGVGLLEAMSALLVLSVGMLAIARLQLDWREHAAWASQQAEAAQLARSEFEGLRAGTDSVQDGHSVDSGSNDGTVYRIAVDSRTPAGMAASQIVVHVRWTDRRGAARHLSMASIVAVTDPRHSGALGLGKAGATAASASAVPVHRAAPGIPVDRQSASKPQPPSTS